MPPSRCSLRSAAFAAALPTPTSRSTNRRPAVTPARKALLALVALVAAAVAPAVAQDLDGFQPASGHGDVALNVSFDSYDHFWRGTENVSTPPPLGEVETTSISLWGRHGLTDRLAVIATLPYVDVDTDGTAGFEDSGLQDATVLFQYRLGTWQRGRSRHTLALGAGLRTPVSSYEADAPVSLGDGSTDGLARAVYLYQRGRLYVSTQVGYDVRGDDVPDGAPLAATVGWDFGRLAVRGTWLRYLASGGTDIGESGFTFPSNEEEFERLGAAAFVRLTPAVGLSVAAFTTLDGRNSGDTDGLSLGVVWSY